MIQRKNKIVLFLPHRADPSRGERFSADLLPLELLQIASGPVADGFEGVMIDAMIEPDYLQKIDEACEGALLFATGPRMLDVAEALAQRRPHPAAAAAP